MKYCLAALHEIRDRLSTAERVLIATDFDGTLCPIAESPFEVHLAPAVHAILRQLLECDRLSLAVISGRALSDVRSRLPLNVTFAGNHGLEIEGPGFRFEHAGAAALRPAVGAACRALVDTFEGTRGVWVEDKALSATLHYRQADERQHRSILWRARYSLRPFAEHLAMRAGKKALELRPRIGWHKGSALAYVRDREGPFDICVCIGDDRTDESMFLANVDGMNIRIGRQEASAANWFLIEQSEIAVLFSHILDVCGPRAQMSAARL